MTDKKEFANLETKFAELFGPATSLRHYFSPGRINLIGEHTDYNGGHVFPASITLGTYGVARPNNDSKVRLYSENFPEVGCVEFDISDLSPIPNDNWTKFVKGMLFEIKKLGYKITHGFDLVINGTIPSASGLSSSASLELLIAVLVNDLFDLQLSQLEMVKLGQQTENDYIGVNSGIMDQFAIGFGAENQTILLDCDTLDYEMVPVDFKNYAILIMNTNKPRELADSKYNERRSECEKALARLQKQLPIKSLGELTEEEFAAHSDLIADPILIKRAHHAVSENARTLKAKRALIADDFVTFGQLLNASHQSLKEDYEVTGIELDTLAETAQKQEGVLGARMTGAGFGGCAIALVREDKLAEVQVVVEAQYLAVTGRKASCYVAHIGAGARKIDD